MTNHLPIDDLREIIARQGWGQIVEQQGYSPDPITAQEPDTGGTHYNLDPEHLTNEQEQLVADAFKVVAACLLNDVDGTYAALLGALLGGAE